MIKSAKEFSNYSLLTKDNDTEKVKDFLFDDRHWVIRYIVADTNKWLPGGQKVIISPLSLNKVEHSARTIPVNLTTNTIKACPPLESKLPVSRQYEERLFKYYGYAFYWMGPGPWGMHSTPSQLLKNDSGYADEDKYVKDNAMSSYNDNIRSCNEVINYRIESKDGIVGHITDFFIDDEKWQIVLFSINTRNWWPGGKDVLISPKCIESISWASHIVKVNLQENQIKEAPHLSQQKFLTTDKTD